jgi:cytochrome c
MNRVCHIAIAAIGLTALSAPAGAQTGDAARGERMYRACVACHSLEPNRNFRIRRMTDYGTGRVSSPASRC